jgi:Na+/proline symporter
MSVNYSASERDVINFNTYVFLEGKHNRKIIFYGRLLCLFTALLALLNFLLSDDKGISLASFIIEGFAAVFFPQLVLLLSKPVFKRQYKANAGLLNNQKITLYDDAIENIDSQITQIYKYTAVTKIVLYKNCYFIFVSEITALLIPSSSFADMNESETFFGILREKTGLSPVTANRR